MQTSEAVYGRLSRISGICVLLCAFIAYLLTMDASVAFWDCPEYVTCASRLEIGHPPGNPIWMLAMRVATIPFPAPYHALVINVCSAIFMALASMLLTRIIFAATIWTVSGLRRFRDTMSRRTISYMAAFAAAGGGLCFALCDSTWFSAVEAEVYAMSAFLSALTIWLMILWAVTPEHGKQWRLLILIAYITGLSLGVHQLNLLNIPVLALIFFFRRHHRGKHPLILWLTLLSSFLIIACILMGMMNGTLVWAAKLELFAVNTLGLPFFTGVYAYLLLLLISFILTLYAIRKQRRLLAAIPLFFFIWLSGVFIFTSEVFWAEVFSAVAAVTITDTKIRKEIISGSVWMLFFILLGYSSFAVILIRGYAAPPMNEAAPTDIFALKRYISREQYGSRPLFYGATPYSTPLVEETFVPGATTPAYTRYVLEKKSPVYSMAREGARLHDRSGFMTAEDSAANTSAISGGKDAYMLGGYTFTRRNAPELDMWFPRITGSSPSLIKSYESWAGMTKENMTRVEVSATLDSLGNPVGKLGADGQRHKVMSWRPTYAQNLRMFLTYQAGYMYFRYLMWNFVGRQNDVSSTGEIEHGNFITGIPVIDNAMLGRQKNIPCSSPYDRKSHVTYYGLPFILGIIGIVFLARSGRMGRRTLAVVSLWFLMTGLAIVVYLNQTPGEPRERDYSFLGSFMAFSIWVAFGLVAIMAAAWRCRQRTVRALAIAVPPVTLVLLLGVANYPSHNRRGRTDTVDFASLILGMKPEGIIFTQGDNFIFPLWYAQEVEGKGTGHQVIEIAYLSTPEYVVNLMRQKHPRLKFIATPEDIAYGAYAFTRVAPDADTIPVPLVKALRDLYAQQEGVPQFRHSRVTIPGNVMADTIVIDLRKMTSGNLIPFKKLMLLDIMAANATSGDHTPLYFLSHLPSDFYSPLKGTLRPNAFADVYAPDIDNDRFIAMGESLAEEIMDKLSSPGNAPAYIDPVMAGHRRRIRGALIRQDGYLSSNGHDSLPSSRIMEIARSYDLVGAGSYTVADTTFNEGIEFARQTLNNATATGNTQSIIAIRDMLLKMRKTAEQWRRYYSSLSATQRTTVSNDTRRQILTLPAIDSLIQTADSLLTTPKSAKQKQPDNPRSGDN